MSVPNMVNHYVFRQQFDVSSTVDTYFNKLKLSCTLFTLSLVYNDVEPQLYCKKVMF